MNGTVVEGQMAVKNSLNHDLLYMLLHYLRSSFRSLFRNRFYTGINLVSLSMGFCAFLILWPYANNELNSDQWHKDANRIARLSSHIEWTDDNINWNGWYTGSNMAGTGMTIKDRFSQVTELTRYFPQENFKMNVQGTGPKVICSVINDNKEKKIFAESKTAYADANFFHFFSFPLVTGTASEVLKNPYSAVISESHAKKYFGSNDPLNQTIFLNDSIPFTITGVFRDVPRNTHLAFDMLFSTAEAKTINIVPSFDWMGYIYVKLQNGNFDEFSKEIEARREELYGPAVGNVKPSVYVQPLPEIVFERLRDNNSNIKSRTPLILLRALAFVILVLAWGNYISLSFSKLNQRLVELGTRKAIGARAMDFLKQFTVESVVINFLSFLMALSLVQLLSPLMHHIGFYVINIAELSIQPLLIILLALAAGVFITGFYPMWISASHAAVCLLKKLKASQKPVWIDGIVIVQYASAVTLIIWIIVAHLQLQFIFNKDIGFDKDAVIVINAPVRQGPNFSNDLETFLHDVKSLSGVLNGTYSYDLPGNGSSGIYVQRNSAANPLALDANGGVDESFIGLFGIQMLAGRNFQAHRPSDQKAVLLSDAAVKRIGLSTVEEAIGSKLLLPNLNGAEVTVIGVYKDYEFRPFLTGQREEGRGSMLTYKHYLAPELRPGVISLRLSSHEPISIVESVEKLFRSNFEGPFHWTFLDENIQQHYTSEKIARNQMSIFTAMAIFIACLGLFGMINNKAIEKTKEIGIRKVMGANITDVAKILLRVTVIQLIVASLIGIPLANFLVDQYLEKFSLRIPLQLWHFIVPVAILLAILLSTIISVVIKAATRNPVESLRYE